MNESGEQLNFMPAHGIGIVHHPYFFRCNACAKFGCHIQGKGVEQLIEALKHGLGVTRQKNFELSLREFLLNSANKGCAVMVNEFVGVAGNDHTFAVLRQGCEATVHLETIGHPEEKLRR